MPPGHLANGLPPAESKSAVASGGEGPGGSVLYGRCGERTAACVAKPKTHPTKAGGPCSTSRCAEMAARSTAGTTVLKALVRDKDRTIFLLNFRNKNNKL